MGAVGAVKGGGGVIPGTQVCAGQFGGRGSIRICYGTVVVNAEHPSISPVPVHRRKLQRGFRWCQGIHGKTNNL